VSGVRTNHPILRREWVKMGLKRSSFIFSRRVNGLKVDSEGAVDHLLRLELAKRPGFSRTVAVQLNYVSYDQTRTHDSHDHL